MSETAPETQTPASPRKKGRSPGYPGIDLELALDRARQLWAAEHHYPASITTILGHWGYAPSSGGGMAALAALKSFGLVEDEGSGDARTAQLTTLAQDILLSENPSTRRELIQQAALSPKIHAELWDKYQAHLQSDQSVQLFLMREKGFTPNGARELVSEYKRTLAFAQLTEGSATVSPNAEGDPKPQVDQITPPSTIEKDQDRTFIPAPSPSPADPKSERVSRTIQVTYSPTEWALLQGRFPMSPEDWDDMIAVLESMKRGLVRRSDPDSEPET